MATMVWHYTQQVTLPPSTRLLIPSTVDTASCQPKLFVDDVHTSISNKLGKGHLQAHIMKATGTPVI
eukprot:jgi/Chlat1/4286/Chrsp29S04558